MTDDAQTEQPAITAEITLEAAGISAAREVGTTDAGEQGNDEPAVSAATAILESSAAASGDAGIAAAESPNVVALDADAQPASDTTSSATTAQADDDTKDAPSLVSKLEVELAESQAKAAYLSNQLDDACKQIALMSNELAAAQDMSAHPIHAILSQIEAELSRPGVVLMSEIRNLLNKGRALL